MTERTLLLDPDLEGRASPPREGPTVEASPAPHRLGRSTVLIGRSGPMTRIQEIVARIAPSQASVIVTGENGTGKEVVARAIHAQSGRSGSFEAVNCGGISPGLIESELFGHERGSFTGAERRHRGYLERAARGTIFLDEIGDMPTELQVKLLRVLETGLFTRVGGESGLRMDARVVAATNRDVPALVRDGRLREDLYYRLKVFQIDVPPLRDRIEDLDLLVEHFLDRLQRIEGFRKRFDDEALDVLRKYRWPGNVRELRNVIHSACILSSSDIVPAHALPAEVRSGDGAIEFDASRISMPVGLPLAEVERRMIMATLSQNHDDKRRTAEALGISLKTLYTRLRRYRQRESS